VHVNLLVKDDSDYIKPSRRLYQSTKSQTEGKSP
jgi:hypothetical protein